jgi:hypothetical protein
MQRNSSWDPSQSVTTNYIKVPGCLFRKNSAGLAYGKDILGSALHTDAIYDFLDQPRQHAHEDDTPGQTTPWIRVVGACFRKNTRGEAFGTCLLETGRDVDKIMQFFRQNSETFFQAPQNTA